MTALSMAVDDFSRLTPEMARVLSRLYKFSWLAVQTEANCTMEVHIKSPRSLVRTNVSNYR